MPRIGPVPNAALKICKLAETRKKNNTMDGVRILFEFKNLGVVGLCLDRLAKPSSFPSLTPNQCGQYRVCDKYLMEKHDIYIIDSNDLS